MPSATSFNILGKLAALAKNLRTHHVAQEAALVDTTTGVTAQLNAEADVQALIGANYIGILAATTGVGGAAQQTAVAAVNRIVYRDDALPGQTLTNNSIERSLREVIRQMLSQGASVRAQTVAATPTAFAGEGNGALVASVKRAGDGLTCEHSFAETVRVTCTQDAYTGGATAGQEGFRAEGEGAVNDPFAFDWPGGSGTSQALTAIDGEQDNGGGNLLVNSDFETFTVANTPDDWTISVGSAGTQVFDESSLVFTGSHALRFTGSGGVLTALYQALDGTDGDELEPLEQYAFNCFMRRDGTAASAGVLTVELVDGNGDVINDEAGVANSFTIDLTALTTSYVSKSGVFRTPLVLPTTVRLRLRMSTALENSRSVYLDKAALGVMTQLYTGGPSLAVFSGADDFGQGDYASAAVTNSRGAAGTLDTFQTACDRLLGLRGFDLLLPSSGTPTISDNLIA
jgi:hypothetical protein